MPRSMYNAILWREPFMQMTVVWFLQLWDITVPAFIDLVKTSQIADEVDTGICDSTIQYASQQLKPPGLLVNL